MEESNIAKMNMCPICFNLMDQKNKKQISNEEFDKQIGLHIKQESEKADAMAFEIFKNAFTADNLYTKQGIC